MKPPKGLKISEERIGEGPHAMPGDEVTYDYECRYNNGELIADSTLYGPYHYRLGCREAAVGIEYGLMGMRKNGVRIVRVPPHLTYVDRQINPEIPEKAQIIYTLKLLKVLPPWDSEMRHRLDCAKIIMS